MSLTLSSGRIFADLTINAGNHPSAQKGHGCYILGISLSLNVKRFEEMQVFTNFTGTLYLESTFVAEHAPVNGATNVCSSPHHQNDVNQTLNFILSKDTLRSIEKKRDGKDLHFTIKINGQVIDENNNHTTVFDEVRYFIPQSQWIGLLKNWNYCQSILLECSFEENSNGTLKNTYTIFKKAQDQFYLGNWKATVSECRNVLENIIENIDIDKGQKNLSLLLKDRKINSLQQRLSLAILAIKEICNSASHADENALSIDWSKEEAEMVLMQTAVFLKRLS